jgi:hypothetical protein
MFEGANSASQGFLWRRAVDAQDKANDATATAIALAQGIGGMRQRVLALEAEVNRLNEAHAIAESFNVGATAQAKALREALKQVAPNHTLLADSGQRFPDGRIKSRIRIIFDQAFDAFAVQCGIKNPASIRDK